MLPLSLDEWVCRLASRRRRSGRGGNVGCRRRRLGGRAAGVGVERARVWPSPLLLGFYHVVRGRVIRRGLAGKRDTDPSTSPSTFAKKRVNSIANVFRLSLKSSSSLTMIGADVMFVERTLSPRSQTATPVACRSPIC